MNYRIEWLNNGLDIINPKIKIVGIDYEIPNSVNIMLIIPSRQFGLLLSNVDISTDDLEKQVLLALNTQYAV